MERSQKLSEQLSKELINYPLSLTPEQIYQRQYHSRPEVRERKSKYDAIYRAKPENKARKKERRQQATAEKKAELREYHREYKRKQREKLKIEMPNYQDFQDFDDLEEIENPLLIRCGKCLKIVAESCLIANCKFEESKTRCKI